MDYLKIYKILIKKRRKNDLDSNYETHHIIPKSIFYYGISQDVLNPCYNISSLDSYTNLVKLTEREHIIAHLLLSKIFKHINKNCYNRLIFASNMMLNRTNSKKSSWFKKEFKQIHSKTLIGKPSRSKGKKWSEEAKKNKSKFHYMKGKTYEEIYGEEKAKILKEKRRESAKKRVVTEEVKCRLSQRPFTEDHKKNISKAKKGVPIKESTRLKIKEYFNNRDKNPKVDQTLYKFYNIDGREIIARKIDMKHDLGVTLVYYLISGKRKSYKGWYYKGEIINDKRL